MSHVVSRSIHLAPVLTLQLFFEHVLDTVALHAVTYVIVFRLDRYLVILQVNLNGSFILHEPDLNT